MSQHLNYASPAGAIPGFILSHVSNVCSVWLPALGPGVVVLFSVWLLGTKIAFVQVRPVRFWPLQIFSRIFRWIYLSVIEKLLVRFVVQLQLCCKKMTGDKKNGYDLCRVSWIWKYLCLVFYEFLGLLCFDKFWAEVKFEWNSLNRLYIKQWSHFLADRQLRSTV